MLFDTQKFVASLSEAVEAMISSIERYISADV